MSYLCTQHLTIQSSRYPVSSESFIESSLSKSLHVSVKVMRLEKKLSTKLDICSKTVRGEQCEHVNWKEGVALQA